MREILKLTEWIEEEIEGCEKYAEAAIKAKEGGESETGRVYYAIAQQECEHAEKLHNVVVSMINARKLAGEEVPKGMQDIWDWKHSEYVKRMTEARTTLAIY